MKEYLVHIPTNQYEFVEVKAKSAEEAKELRDEVLNAFQEAKNTPNSGLKSTDLLRLGHKLFSEQGLIMEELDSLGTEKIYSQKDFINFCKNIVAKFKRDGEQGTRAESSHRIIN